MTSLPSGEVTLHEVMEWAQEQAQFLTPTQTHVLWYLCLNSWRKPGNKEAASPGQVLSGRAPLRKIQMGTGLSKRAVIYALDSLQSKGYIVRDHQPGHGRSEVLVLWEASDDEFRAEVRAGVRKVPESFQKPTRTATPGKKETALAIILPFPSVHDVQQ